MKHENTFPYVFVVGCPRSGTTLLQRMLDAHPRLAIANDTHFIPRAIEKHGLHTDMRLTPELINYVRDYKRFHRLGVDPADVDIVGASSSTYPEFVAGLYRKFSTNNNKPLGGEKTPDYVRSIPLLHYLFPQARFIHIIRDGREVALSTMQWANAGKGPGRLEKWTRSPLAVSALWWAWQTGCGCRDGRPLGDDLYQEVHYADLVADPEPTLARLAKFLGLPNAPEMSRFHEGKTRSGSGLSAKSAWLPATPGLREFSSELSAEDLSLFEAVAGTRLQALGYELAGGIPSAEISATAREISQWWRGVLEKKRKKSFDALPCREATG